MINSSGYALEFIIYHIKHERVYVSHRHLLYNTRAVIKRHIPRANTLGRRACISSKYTLCAACCCYIRTLASSSRLSHDAMRGGAWGGGCRHSTSRWLWYGSEGESIPRARMPQEQRTSKFLSFILSLLDSVTISIC